MDKQQETEVGKRLLAIVARNRTLWANGKRKIKPQHHVNDTFCKE